MSSSASSSSQSSSTSTRTTSSTNTSTKIGWFLLIALAPVYIILLLNGFQVPHLQLRLLQLPIDFDTLSALKNLSRVFPSFIKTSSSPLSTLSRPLSTTTTINTMSDIQIVPRRSEERGNADHGWLKTFHTFSFAMYQESKHDRYGCLRVINEDRVAAHTGFGTHSHREFEIFSYVVDGELE
ncbi:Pirin-domain-containing protein, partial [Dendrothele bispora CBS 962.96]